MRAQASINKKAWEYRAYEFWNQRNGTPAEYAAEIKANPTVRRIHQKYFEDVKGKKIANPCGSNGRQAIPLAVLGADVTIFDISKENKQYALELAKEADVDIKYILGDFCEINFNEDNEYTESFDIVYAEGGIIHYFTDIDMFTKALYAITKSNGQLVLSDYHPYRKMTLMTNGSEINGDYFDSQLHNVNVAYQDGFSEEEQEKFPKCLCRYYTMSEIINSVITSGFTLKEFIEHPKYDDKKIPGEYTIIAYKA